MDVRTNRTNRVRRRPGHVKMDTLETDRMDGWEPTRC